MSLGYRTSPIGLAFTALNNMQAEYLRCPHRLPHVQLTGRAHATKVQAAMVSVDSEGSLLIWPPEDSSRSGYGWFMPTHHYGLPRRLPVFVPQPNRSDPHVDARTDPAIDQSEGEASAAANLDPDARVSSNPSPETGLRTDGNAETDLPKDSEQDALQARELEADNDGETDILGPPQGDGLNPNLAATEDAFWEEERILWLVKYEWESKTLIQNRVERPIVRSSFDKDAMVATSFAVSTTTTSGEKHSTKRVKQQVRYFMPGLVYQHII